MAYQTRVLLTQPVPAAVLSSFDHGFAGYGAKAQSIGQISEYNQPEVVMWQSYSRAFTRDPQRLEIIPLTAPIENFAGERQDYATEPAHLLLQAARRNAFEEGPVASVVQIALAFVTLPIPHAFASRAWVSPI